MSKLTNKLRTDVAGAREQLNALLVIDWYDRTAQPCSANNADELLTNAKILLTTLDTALGMIEVYDKEHENTPDPILSTWGMPQLVIQHKYWFEKYHAATEAAITDAVGEK